MAKFDSTFQWTWAGGLLLNHSAISEKFSILTSQLPRPFHLIWSKKNWLYKLCKIKPNFTVFNVNWAFTRRFELVLIDIWYRNNLFLFLRVLLPEESLKNSFSYTFCNENNNTEPEKSWSAEPLSDLLRKLIRLFGHLSNARYTPCPRFSWMRGYWGYFVD